MEKKIVKTSDGSNTLFIPKLNETYHSIHGAINESKHVFIQEGLRYLGPYKKVSILEVGFGTGLNALLSLVESNSCKRKLEYTSIDAFPLNWELVSQLNYLKELSLPNYESFFKKMHTCNWGNYVNISRCFDLRKLEIDIKSICFESEFNLIYFDAFAPTIQPELWTKQIFTSMFKALKPNGVLVTYCAKGIVKRVLKEVGFELQSISGPPGKREMSRAIKY